MRHATGTPVAPPSACPDFLPHLVLSVALPLYLALTVSRLLSYLSIVHFALPRLCVALPIILLPCLASPLHLALPLLIAMPCLTSSPLNLCISLAPFLALLFGVALPDAVYLRLRLHGKAVQSTQ